MFVTATAAFIVLLLSCVIQALFLLWKKEDHFSRYLLLLSSLLLLVVIVLRSVEIRFVALTNIYESLLFFSAAVSLVLFFFRSKKGSRVHGLLLFSGSVIALAFLAVASSPLSVRETVPPVPALRSYWLVLHVSFAFIGEAFFALGFVSSLIQLFRRDAGKRQEADRVTYTAIGIGYPVFTVGALVFGAVWAEAAWGSYWSWDPKETWALVTWIVYTIYLHLRLIRKRSDRLVALVSVAGFLFAVFTFLGVNYLIGGLHSYR